MLLRIVSISFSPCSNVRLLPFISQASTTEEINLALSSSAILTFVNRSKINPSLRDLISPILDANPFLSRTSSQYPRRPSRLWPFRESSHSIASNILFPPVCKMCLLSGYKYIKLKKICMMNDFWSKDESAQRFLEFERCY